MTEEEKINQFLRRFRPLAEAYGFSFTCGAVTVGGKPNVLFLGNHSAGKSTFINHLLGGDVVQDTGVAPTDDGFTFLRYGADEDDIHGPAALAHLGADFAALNRLGPRFLNRIRVKIRNREVLQRVNLVDSPGMIDAAGSDVRRDYDFMAAVRRLAETTDMVILMFDPDKPGTTGETLSCLRECLLGMEFKLHILLNKADCFQNMNDFARACGALCWNLARAMRTKDLPRIYTTYIPGAAAGASVMPLADFDRYRDEIVAQIRNAGRRRTDNMIAMVRTDLPRLAMQARVLAAARRAEAARAWFWRLAAFAGGLAAGLAAAGVFRFLLDWRLRHAGLAGILAAAAVAAAFLALGRWHAGKSLARDPEDFDRIFDRVYARHLAMGACDDLRDTWGSLRDSLPRIMTTLRPRLPLFPGRRLRRLDRIIANDLAKLGSTI